MHARRSTVLVMQRNDSDMTPSTSAPPAADSDEALLLPASGFFADASVGVGHVHLPDDFQAIDLPQQLSILSGWRKGVDEAWRQSLVHAFRQRFGQDTRPLPERLEAFRREAAVDGIELPADFPLALQRY
jgi:hypothetical protein